MLGQGCRAYGCDGVAREKEKERESEWGREGNEIGAVLPLANRRVFFFLLVERKTRERFPRYSSPGVIPSVYIRPRCEEVSPERETLDWFARTVTHLFLRIV